MEWTVRQANKDDCWKIVSLTRDNLDVLMPYTAGVNTTMGYIDQFMVAESWPEIYKGDRKDTNSTLYLRGAVHFIPNDDVDIRTSDRVECFLNSVKQVPYDLVCDFMSKPHNRKLAFIGQVICPGKGSFYAILEEAKKQYDEIWCWMSIAGPSYKSYQRYGFNLNMDDVREFWNVYKCDYSKFVLGKWIKEV